jgi:hypothetical protein
MLLYIPGSYVKYSHEDVQVPFLEAEKLETPTEMYTKIYSETSIYRSRMYRFPRIRRSISVVPEQILFKPLK